MILATPFLLGVALIAALCGEERSRVSRLGFAILGGGYFVLAFLGLSEPNLITLPTSRLLAYVHQQVARGRCSPTMSRIQSIRSRSLSW